MVTDMKYSVQFRVGKQRQTQFLFQFQSKKHFMCWIYSSVVEHVPGMHEVLGSTPSASSKGGKEKKRAIKLFIYDTKKG